MSQKSIERIDYFQANVEYRHPGASHNSGCYTPEETLAEARQELTSSYHYYSDLNAQGVPTQIVWAGIRRVCKMCSGGGKVLRGKRVRKVVRCPACRGRNPSEVVEVWVNLPKELWI